MGAVPWSWNVATEVLFLTSTFWDILGPESVTAVVTDFPPPVSSVLLSSKLLVPSLNSLETVTFNSFSPEILGLDSVICWLSVEPVSTTLILAGIFISYEVPFWYFISFWYFYFSNL